MIKLIKKIMQKNREKHIFIQISKYFGYVWALIKMMFGLFSGYYFLCISALYTLSFSVCKEVFFKGKKIAQNDSQTERRYYLMMAAVLTIASIVYIVYTLRLFYFPEHKNYGLFFGISYAVFAFTDIIIAIVNLSRAYKRKSLLFSGVKSVSLATAFIALAFSQVALLGFTASDADLSLYNALFGLIMGIGCLIICAFMFIKYLILSKAAARGDVPLLDQLPLLDSDTILTETQTEEN